MFAPYLTALMAASLELKPTDRVLEIGTGSGYEAAILSRIAAEVYTVEQVGSLADSARRRLADLGYRVSVLEGDGKLGWRAHAPLRRHRGQRLWSAGTGGTFGAAGNRRPSHHAR
jgi:protein-L-isoaspartate(D-aspartate) O-methyltransferase